MDINHVKKMRDEIKEMSIDDFKAFTVMATTKSMKSIIDNVSNPMVVNALISLLFGVLKHPDGVQDYVYEEIRETALGGLQAIINDLEREEDKLPA
jgi:hypothetical protein